jgi:ComF family protein
MPTILSANCFVCGRRSPTGHACANCRKQNHSSLAGIFVAADWNNLLLRQIIYEYKYRFIKELAEPLSELIISFLNIAQPACWPKQPDHNQLLIIPVPLHGQRLAWRGFNQSELLAQKTCSHFNIDLAKNLLIRYRHTIPQREIADKKIRLENIKKAFSLSPKIKVENYSLKNKIVILIDDVSTTGATLGECARELQKLKPKEIWGLVIARG